MPRPLSYLRRGRQTTRSMRDGLQPTPRGQYLLTLMSSLLVLQPLVQVGTSAEEQEAFSTLQRFLCTDLLSAKGQQHR